MKKWFSLLLVCCLLAGLLPAGAEEAPAALPEAGDVVAGFRAVEVRDFPLVGGTAVLFEHEKTGAQLMYIANEDVNRVFDLTFFTRATDNTGLPHVFEHATLNGSEKYPSKSLFFNLSYQTYNTFMNAMTYASMTTYPVASLSEAQLLQYADFYTDSCLHPLIMQDESIYRQEAWRYRLDSTDAPLTIEGTVYSEMLGATTIERMASMENKRAAFPGSVIGNDQGGDPDDIPDMTWQALRDYHDLYYHPSNSIAYLYGRFEDYTAFLRLLDGYYAAYDKKEFHWEDADYTPLTGKVEKTVSFPVEASSDTERASVIYYTIVCPGLQADPRQAMTLDLMAELFSASASPVAQAVRQALPQASFGVTIEFNGPEDAICFVLENADPQDAELFVSTVDASLAQMAEEGFPADFLDAASASLAISILLTPEESGVGTSIVPTIAYNHTLYGHPFAYMDYVDALMRITEMNDQGEFASFVRQYLAGSQTTALVTVTPEAGAREKKDAALAERLAAVKDAMTDEEKQALVEASNAPEEPDDASRYIAQLQAVTVSSLPEETRIFQVANELGEDGVRRIDSLAAVEGVGSVHLFFDAAGLPQEDIHWMRLFIDLIGEVDTAEHTWEELSTLITRYLYSVSVRINVLDEGEGYHPYLRASWTSLDEDLDKGYDLMAEILLRSDFGDTAHVGDLIRQKKAALKNSITNGAYNILLYRALSVTDPSIRYYNYANYLDYYAFLEKTETLMAEDPAAVVASLVRVQNELLQRGGAVTSFAGNEESIALNRPLADALMASLPLAPAEPVAYDLPVPAKREALVIDSSVQYNLLFADHETLGLAEDGAMQVITALVSDGFLYPILRDQYGAYGVLHSDMREQGMYILSYRDPNITQTFEVYEALPEMLAETGLDQETLDGYILYTYSDYAMPTGELTGAVAAIASVLQGKESGEALETMRQIKAVTPERLAEAAETYAALAEKGIRSTAGGMAAIQEHADLYDQILTPFSVQ